MVTVDEYARIRLAHRDGMSIRAIARTFHHSRHKVRQILDNAEPRPYTRSQVAAAPVLGPFHGIIDEILKTDEEAPPKQRHTAMQLYRRLCAEHAYGGATTRSGATWPASGGVSARRLSPCATIRASAWKPISVSSTSIFPKADSKSRCSTWSGRTPTVRLPSPW